MSGTEAVSRPARQVDAAVATNSVTS